MAQPVNWPKKTFFYPIGNTPPVCLTQGLSPEKNADILLLGCGDPRNILHTVYSDLALGNRHLDFTCCDWEPAVLARNILLLTMIVDGVAVDTAWSIFYHFFLDSVSHDILVAQCRNLLQTSSDMKTWKDSKYGSFLRFCTERSLTEIKRHWALYAESKDLSETERKALRMLFQTGMKSVRERYGETITFLRAAGPLFMSPHLKGFQMFTSFWTTGVTPSKSPQSISTPYTNPTFLYSLSGKKFNVHYGTNPITAFFLAPALGLDKNGKPPASVISDDLVKSVKAQFAAMFSSFRTRLSFGPGANIVIRFFVGESLAFSRALHICREQKTRETGVYAHLWGGLPIMLDADDYSSFSTAPAPLLFNVIETSNLADHTGLLNLLVATVPLLERKPWSIIHTNTLLRTAKSGLNDSACADIPTLSMLLGIAPSSHLWHFTSHSNKHEVINADLNSGQFHDILSWRFVSSFAPNAVFKPEDTDLGHFKLLCDAEKLGKFFFAVYLQMFSNENQMMNMRNVGDMDTFNKQNIIYYVRESFVAFLALVKGSIGVDWTETMNHLVDLIGSDRSFMMGLNNYQDLMCHLFLRKVHSLHVLTSAYLEAVRTPRDRFCDWKSVPPVVCIVLKVPRQQLKRLEDMDGDEILTPMLQCETMGATFHNIHSSIHLTFGDTLASVIDGESQVTIKQDPKGWSGSSSLIVTFYLPSWILTHAPTATQVGLYIRSTPLSTHLIPRLGMRLAIFSTSLTDTAHVQVVRHRPGNALEIEYIRNTPGYTTPTASENIREVMMKFDPSGEWVTNLVIRRDIADPIAASSLASGSNVLLKPIADSALLVTFGDYTYRFTYPFPVDMKRLKTRIARKSSFIEIEAAVRPGFSDFRDLSLNPFAVAHDSKPINLLNIHYLNLDILPALSLPGKEKDLEWIPVHVGMMLSEAEKQARENPIQKERGALVNMKESIAALFIKYAGLQLASPEEWSRVFGLSDRLNGGVYAYIFVNAMKFDLASHTIVLDACVVHLHDEIMSKLGSAFNALYHRHFVEVMTDADEKKLWILLFPVLAERCRTWGHTDACEYRTRGIPCSGKGSEYNPLCSCGKGKNLGRFGTVTEWRPFYEEATRVAIGPLFAFSFVKVSQSLNADKSHCAKCGGPGKPTLQICGACKKTQYCSRECQKDHWKVHKKVCAAAK